MSIGKAKLRISSAGNLQMEIEIDVVDITVPLISGLDNFYKHKQMMENVVYLLVWKDPKWSTSITRKNWHLYYKWQYDVIYTEECLPSSTVNSTSPPRENFYP